MMDNRGLGPCKNYGYGRVFILNTDLGGKDVSDGGVKPAFFAVETARKAVSFKRFGFLRKSGFGAGLGPGAPLDADRRGLAG